ncbi:NYN domain-containing protein, partial [Synechococcus sp. R60.2]
MQASSPTFLLVDGYNIIGAWPTLSQLARRSLMELARLRLVESLANYVAFRGY